MADYETRTIEEVQSSTRYLLSSFKGKIDVLKKAGPDLKRLLRFGVDYDAAFRTAVRFFGKEDVKYIAIDGTDALDEQLDLLVFYVGAFAYVGSVKLSSAGVDIGDAAPGGSDLSVSAAIPLSEEDAALVFGQKTQSGVEVDPERLPGSIMHLSEYYLAYKAAAADGSLKVILMDRTLAGDVGHLNWSTKELIEDHACILEGIDTPYGRVTSLDLQLARMLLPNSQLKTPAPRSQLLKYAALELLFQGDQLSSQQIIGRLGAQPVREEKLRNEFGELESEFHLFEKVFNYKLRPDVKSYWERVLAAAGMVAEHIFDPKGGHPLRFRRGAREHWITADDLDFMTLVFIHALTRKAWADNLLLIGMIKDTSASELVNSVVPILENAGKLKPGQGLPSFNSDKMLLQTNSVINAADVPTPWHTIDMDAAFRTMAPEQDPRLKKGEALVRGAFKNVVNAERAYVKTYIQLWSSQANPAVRSHVFSFDRPAFAGYDHWDEVLIHHQDDKVDEKIAPILHFDSGSDLTNLAMAILVHMGKEVVPEAIGHNYPLFLADKKAKAILKENREAYLGAVALEMSKSDLDQQVLFSSRFRDYRSQVEAKRKR